MVNPEVLKRLQQAREKKERKSVKEKKLAVADLEQWFREGDKISTGKCKHCGGKSCKGDPLYYKHSQAHILPKRLFASVATHPLNRIELCFWNNNCHGNYDNGILDLIDMNCFDEIIEKFVTMYPDIAKEERRHIPDILLQYVEANS